MTSKKQVERDAVSAFAEVDAHQVAVDAEVIKAKAKASESQRKYKHAQSTITDMERLLEAAASMGKGWIGEKFTRAKRVGKSKATAIIQWSDWHIEERIDPATINGMNEFSPDIAYERVTKELLPRTAELLDVCNTLSGVSSAVLHLGGDFITGYIHPELEESNYLTPSEAAGTVEEWLYEGIAFLLRETPIKHVDVITSVGNHGRNTQKTRHSTRVKNNLEWYMYQHLARMLDSEKRVRFSIGEAYHSYLEVEGRVCRFHHGDEISRNSGAGTGVGGIAIPINRKIDKWSRARHADFDFFGHYHNRILYRHWLMNGCLCGPGAYAIDGGFGVESPSQNLTIMDRQRGVTMPLEVFCT